MIRPVSTWLRRAVACALAFALPAFAQLPVVPGESAQAPKETAVARLRIEAQVAARPELRAQVRLAPVTAAELDAVRRANGADRSKAPVKRIVIGIARDAQGTATLPAAADLAWIAVDGGHAAQMAVTSPQAAALRTAIDLAGVPGDVEMVFVGSGDPARLVGPIRVAEIADRTTAWWSPVTEGETQTVEFFVPGERDPRELGLRSAGVSHLFAGPSSRFEKRLQDIGLAGSCNVDVPCSALETSAAFQDAAASVAQMVFADGGFTTLCTGTLLNDTDPSSQVPWFYSANHCFENQSAPYKTPAEMQAVANTLSTLWFFQSSACSSSVVSASYRQLSAGATFLYNNPATDVLFLRLNGSPPQGAFYAGWDANPIGVGSAVLAIHHPQGDLKKVSQGNVLGSATPSIPPASGGVNQYTQVRWSSGTTEPGSSGAGLFTSSGSQYVLRGALWGGSASCTSPSSPDLFSRFDVAYPALAAYLSPVNVPTADFSDLWWNPGESGWGLNIVQHSTRVIFAVWYTYGTDGKRTWFVMPSGSWTATNTYTGPLYSVSGPPYNGAFDPAQVGNTQVGTGTLRFTDANNGSWGYTVNGVSGSKVITRQAY